MYTYQPYKFNGTNFSPWALSVFQKLVIHVFHLALAYLKFTFINKHWFFHISSFFL